MMIRDSLLIGRRETGTKTKRTKVVISFRLETLNR